MKKNILFALIIFCICSTGVFADYFFEKNGSFFDLSMEL